MKPVPRWLKTKVPEMPALNELPSGVPPGPSSVCYSAFFSQLQPHGPVNQLLPISLPFKIRSKTRAVAHTCNCRTQQAGAVGSRPIYTTMWDRLQRMNEGMNTKPKKQAEQSLSTLWPKDTVSGDVCFKGAHIPNFFLFREPCVHGFLQSTFPVSILSRRLLMSTCHSEEAFLTCVLKADIV